MKSVSERLGRPDQVVGNGAAFPFNAPAVVGLDVDWLGGGHLFRVSGNADVARVAGIGPSVFARRIKRVVGKVAGPVVEAISNLPVREGHGQGGAAHPTTVLPKADGRPQLTVNP